MNEDGDRHHRLTTRVRTDYALEKVLAQVVSYRVRVALISCILQPGAFFVVHAADYTLDERRIHFFNIEFCAEISGIECFQENVVVEDEDRVFM